MKKITEDTNVYLNDIVATADLLREEVERIESELFDSNGKVKDPSAFEALTEDIASEIFKQKTRLEKVHLEAQ